MTDIESAKSLAQPPEAADILTGFISAAQFAGNLLIKVPDIVQSALLEVDTTPTVSPQRCIFEDAGGGIIDLLRGQ